jgi:glycosyltransferase involved in cell wall biosynthesis
MKVIQLLYSGLGGHGSVAFSLIDADLEAEWTHCLGFIGVEPLLSSYKNKCREKDIPFKYFPIRKKKSSNSIKEIFIWLKSIKPEAIIVHSSSALIPSLLYGKLNKVKVVYVEHQANSLKSKNEWIMSQFAAFFASNVVVLTNSYLLELSKKIIMSKKINKIKIIPNGINENKFSYRPEKIISDTNIKLGMSSRLVKNKSHEKVFEAMNILQKIAPQYNFTFSIAGDGQQIEWLRQLSSQLGLAQVIRFEGVLDEADLIEWYTSLDIYVHYSEAETLSTSLLQAMAIGIPIVASDVPGINNLLNEDEMKDFLFDFYSVNSFANAILKLINKQNLTVKYRKLRRFRIESEYSLNQMFQNYNNLLKKN